jgi:hypothetical protein
MAECAGCGYDVNGIRQALIVSDFDAEQGIVVNYVFCRDREDTEGKTVKGCAGKVIRPAVLEHHLSVNSTATGKPAAEPTEPMSPPGATTPAEAQGGDTAPEKEVEKPRGRRSGK